MDNLILSVDRAYMHDPRLELLDKILLSYISTWEKKGLTCYAKDGFFAYLLGESEESIQFSLAKCSALNLIFIVRGIGGRTIRTVKVIEITEEGTEPDIFGLY